MAPPFRRVGQSATSSTSRRPAVTHGDSILPDIIAAGTSVQLIDGDFSVVP